LLAPTVDTLQGKTCQNSLFWRGWVNLSQDFSGRGCPWVIFFGFYKTRHILLYHSANCTVLRAVVLTQYWRLTDGGTDGIGITSTALAMRALWSAVKTDALLL